MENIMSAPVFDKCAASKINRRMNLLACNAELCPGAVEFIANWFTFAQKWNISNNRPMLGQALYRINGSIHMRVMNSTLTSVYM